MTTGVNLHTDSEVTHSSIVVRESDVLDFARTVLDPARHYWIILVSARRTPGGEEVLPLDLEILRRRMGNRARIAVLPDSRASYALSSLSEMYNLAAWNGAVRMLAPGARTGDSYTLHPLLRNQDDLPDQVSKILRARLDTAEIQEFSGKGVDFRSQVVVQQERLVNELRKQIADKDKIIRELRQKVQKLSKQVRSHTVSDEDPVWSDPEKQLNYEIRETWLRQVAEYDRDTYPLPDTWLLGVDFLASLAEMTVVGRDVVLATVVDVLTGRAATISGRYLHMQRGTEASSAEQLVRHDGAAAWRCAVRQALPSAPRLMWWRHPNNTIELGRVALHDDYRLR